MHSFTFLDLVVLFVLTHSSSYNPFMSVSYRIFHRGLQRIGECTVNRCYSVCECLRFSVCYLSVFLICSL